MGANDLKESMSYGLALYSRDERRILKHVHDNVHGNIYLDPLSLKFIDTEQFQRLRDLKQLDHQVSVRKSSEYVARQAFADTWMYTNL